MRKYLIFGCAGVIVVAMIALLIVTNNKTPANTEASKDVMSQDTISVKIKNVDLNDTEKNLNGATFKIKDITSSNSTNDKEVTIAENGETYVDLEKGNYTIELVSPAPNYSVSNDVKSFSLSDSSIEPFNIIIKSELQQVVAQDINSPLINAQNKSSFVAADKVPEVSTDLLPTTSSDTNNIFVSDSPSKNPQTNDNFFKYSFFILVAGGINFALINTFFYLKKLR